MGRTFLIRTLNSEAIKEIVDRFDNGKKKKKYTK